MSVLLAGAFGKNLRAMASNENAARAFGIDVRHHLIAAFTWSSALIAFAGAVSAPRFRIIDPDSYGILTSIFTLAYPIIGGMGSIWGGLAGGGILRVIPELLRPLADYIELIFCVLVVATLTFFPDGLASAFWRATAAPQPCRRRRPGSRRAKSSVARIAELFAATESLRSGVARHSPATPRSLQSRTYPNRTEPCAQSMTYRSRLRPGSLHGLMGPNGAGKTTLFNIVSGFVSAGQPATCCCPVPRSTRCRSSGALGLGMTRTFQHAAVFERLSCLDNVIIGLGRNTVVQGTRSQHWQPRSTAQSSRAERRAALAALEAVGLGAAGTKSPERCRWAISAGWRLRARSCRGRGSSCSTSRFRAYRSRKRNGCASSCSRSIVSSALPWW